MVIAISWRMSVGCAPRFWEFLLDYWLCMILIDFEVNLVDLKKASMAFYFLLLDMWIIMQCDVHIRYTRYLIQLICSNASICC